LKQILLQAKDKLLEHTWGRVAWRAILAYNKHNVLFLTSGLSFFALISMIPLAYLGFMMLAANVGSDVEAMEQLRTTLEQYLLPETTDILLNRVRALSRISLADIWGAWWGVIIFVWSGVRFFEMLQMTLTTAWGGSDIRPFWSRKFFTVAIFLAAWLLTAAAILLSSWVAALHNIDELYGIAFPELWPQFWAFLAWVVNLVLAVVAFLLLYKYMPTVDVPWRVAFWTALPVAVVWELTKILFTTLVVKRGTYATLYGPMAGLVLLMVWIYLTAQIVLIGAELGAAWQIEKHGSLNGSGNGSGRSPIQAS
jgi:membrane protein